MRTPPRNLVAALIVLVGASLVTAVLFGPSRVDRSSRPVMSERSLNFGAVPVNTDDAEMLLTVRNGGHDTATVNASIVLRDWAAVCPPSLSVHARMSECGFTQAGATDPACEALKPGASCALSIDFKPRVARSYRARYCVEFSTMGDGPRGLPACAELVGRGSTAEPK